MLKTENNMIVLLQVSIDRAWENDDNASFRKRLELVIKVAETILNSGPNDIMYKVDFFNSRCL